MQQALPYRIWTPAPEKGSIGRPVAEATNSGGVVKVGTSVKRVVTESAVVVFGRRGCCMCHVVKRLLLGLGVNPAVYEVEEEDEVGVVDELGKIGGDEENSVDGGGGGVQFPAVFIGGRLFGGLDRLMATHISGELNPILKQAGALWL